MISPYKIAHITDCHIPPDDIPVRGINARQQFENVLSSVALAKPQLIVLGGDLAAEAGEVESYRWIRFRLEALGIPYLLVPGNHDKLDNLALVFGNKCLISGDWGFAVKKAGVLLAGVDSSRDLVSAEQLFWIQQVAGATQIPVLLFIHHPPLDCNCLFMDRRYPLKNRDDVFQAFGDIPRLQAIFCGHYHTEKTLLKNGGAVFITPSTLYQISQDQQDYHLASTCPGWRLIELLPEQLSTRVIWIDRTSSR